MGVINKTIRIFGSAGDGFIPQYEPMIQNRYLLTIPNPNDASINQFLVKSEVGNPSMRMEEIPYFTTSTYRIAEWSPITFQILDTLTPTNPEFFREWMLSGYEYITGRQGYATNNKRNVRLEKINPVGDIVSSWELHGCQIQEMRHEMVYDNTIGDIEIRLLFDNATLTF